jgi:predicted MPP superfamily phosphohydrolase
VDSFVETINDGVDARMLQQADLEPVGQHPIGPIGQHPEDQQRSTWPTAAPSRYNWRIVTGLLMPAALLVFIMLTLRNPTLTHAAGLGSKQPEHLTLTWQHDPATTQSFTWRTAAGQEGTVVEYIETANYIGFPYYKAQQIIGMEIPFLSDAGEMLIHEAEAVGLQPNVSYTYRVGSGNNGEWSGPHQFVSGPDPLQPFSFLFVSDTQAFPNQSTVNGYGIWSEMLAKALKQQPDARFVLLSGDIVDYGYLQDQWEQWFHAARDMLPGINMVPTLGNHDVLKTGTKNFRAQFQLPRNGPMGEEELAYSFDYGAMHIAVLNSEGDLTSQAAWLREDMAASTRPWKIAAFHRSPFQSHAERASIHVRDAWTPIFDETGVDLVLTGHDHAYMRSWPLYQGENVADGEGTTYVIGGTAGSKFYDMGDFPWMRVKFDDNTQIFSTVSVTQDELAFRVTTRDGSSIDAFKLYKPVYGQRYMDVFPSHWAHDTIESLSKDGIIEGIEPGQFHPSKETTRAEFTSMVAKALQLPAEETSSFIDVQQNQWHYKAIAAAAKAGLVQGIDSNHFGPDSWLTRQELAALLVRAYEWKTQKTPMAGGIRLSQYKDRPEMAVWATPAIEAALELQLLAGRTDILFAPREFATRAETARALENLLANINPAQAH